MTQITVNGFSNGNVTLTTKQEAVQYLEGLFVKEGVRSISSYEPTTEVSQICHLFEIDLTHFKPSVLEDVSIQQIVGTPRFLKHYDEGSLAFSAMPVAAIVNLNGYEASTVLDELIAKGVVPINHSLSQVININIEESMKSINTMLNNSNFTVLLFEDEDSYNFYRDMLKTNSLPSFEDYCLIEIEVDASYETVDVKVSKDFESAGHPSFKYVEGSYPSTLIFEEQDEEDEEEEVDDDENEEEEDIEEEEEPTDEDDEDVDEEHDDEDNTVDDGDIDEQDNDTDNETEDDIDLDEDEDGDDENNTIDDDSLPEEEDDIDIDESNEDGVPKYRM